MRKSLIYISILTLLVSCTDQKKKQFRAIKDLEQSEAMGTPEGLAKLAELHKNYGKKYKDSIANGFLYAAATYYYFGEQIEESQPLLEEYIQRDDSSVRAKNALLNLSQIYAKQGEYDDMARVIDQALKKHNPTTTQWYDILQAYESRIKANAGVSGKDYEQAALAKSALNDYEDAVEYLIKGAERFKDYEKRPSLIYRAGFICWEYLNDTDKAKQYYTQFLAEYPDHELATEVEQIVNSGMLEMTDEQILEMLKSKQ